MSNSSQLNYCIPLLCKYIRTKKRVLIYLPKQIVDNITCIMVPLKKKRHPKRTSDDALIKSLNSNIYEYLATPSEILPSLK